MHAFPFKESHVNIYNVYILTPIINFFFYSFCDNNNYFLLFLKLKLKKMRQNLMSEERTMGRWSVENCYGWNL